jgi:hypothetical protein
VKKNLIKNGNSKKSINNKINNKPIIINSIKEAKLSKFSELEFINDSKLIGINMDKDKVKLRKKKDKKNF